MDVGVKFGDSILEHDRIIRLFADRIRFVPYLFAFYSRPQEANDVTPGKFVTPTDPDKCLISVASYPLRLRGRLSPSI